MVANFVAVRTLPSLQAPARLLFCQGYSGGKTESSHKAITRMMVAEHQLYLYPQ